MTVSRLCRPGVPRSAGRLTTTVAALAAIGSCGLAQRLNAQPDVPPSGAPESSGRSANWRLARGIQAYRAGRDNLADDYLTRAIEQGDADPRPHYFRALARWRAGNTAHAREDLRQGARLEAAAPRRWAVDQALAESVDTTDGVLRQLVDAYRNPLPPVGSGTQSGLAEFPGEMPRRPVQVRLEHLLAAASPDDLLERPAQTAQPHVTAKPALADVAPVPRRDPPADVIPATALVQPENDVTPESDVTPEPIADETELSDPFVDDVEQPAPQERLEFEGEAVPPVGMDAVDEDLNLDDLFR